MGPREQQTLEKAASALVACEGNSKVEWVDPRQSQSKLRPALCSIGRAPERVLAAPAHGIVSRLRLP